MILDVLTEAIVQEYRITPLGLTGRCRTALYSEARQMMMYILRQEYGMTVLSISKALHRCQNTVYHGLSVIEGLMEYDSAVRGRYERIISTIRQ